MRAINDRPYETDGETILDKSRASPVDCCSMRARPHRLLYSRPFPDANVNKSHHPPQKKEETPSEASIKDGSYAVQRPFVLVTKEGVALSKTALAGHHRQRGAS